MQKDNVFDFQKPVSPINQEAREQAELRQTQLTKPPGSLGELEDIAIQFAGWQGCERPSLDRAVLRIFAADHGVCKQGVSAFPQLVTQQMIHNFCNGGAAISVLSNALAPTMKHWSFQVLNMGTIEPMPELEGLVNKQITQGTADFTVQPAMTKKQLFAAMNSGALSVCSDCSVDSSADSSVRDNQHSGEKQPQLFIGGEMGIGNTTSAAALIAGLYGLTADQVAGRGTGVDDQGLSRKKEAIDRALKLHDIPLKNALESSSLEQGLPESTTVKNNIKPIDWLQRVGGLEIAALTGAYIYAAQEGIPSLVDGFICTAAAACAVALNPGVKDWLLFAHCSAEQAHRMVLERLEAKPILQLSMRLGEGSGAATAVPTLKLALELHANMHTFAEAGVTST